MSYPRPPQSLYTHPMHGNESPRPCIHPMHGNEQVRSTYGRNSRLTRSTHSCRLSSRTRRHLAQPNSPRSTTPSLMPWCMGYANRQIRKSDTSTSIKERKKHVRYTIWTTNMQVKGACEDILLHLNIYARGKARVHERLSACTLLAAVAYH